MIRRIGGPEEFRTIFNVSRETMRDLEHYAELLLKWQKAVNLVAHSTLDDVWHRHIGDSAQIVDIVKESDSSKKDGIWLDIGSGGGFPGLVAAIMMREAFGYHFHLVESNTRKCAFLSDVVRHLDLPVQIHDRRIEQLYEEAVPVPVHIVTARALASLDKLLALSLPFFGENTVALFFKGHDVDRELADAERNWQFRFRKYNSLTSPGGRILHITGLKRNGVVEPDSEPTSR